MTEEKRKNSVLAKRSFSSFPKPSSSTNLASYDKTHVKSKRTVKFSDDTRTGGRVETEQRDRTGEGDEVGHGDGEKSRAATRREAKELKRQRRLQKPGAELLEAAKPDWEACRRTDLTPEERTEPLGLLFSRLQGHFAEALLKSDGSRMVQTLIKYGSKEQRDVLATELKGHFLELSKNPYGKHIVLKLLQNCPSHQSLIASEFRGHVSKCLRHTHASSVVDTVYSDYCKAAERNDMLHEFYGPEFALFADHRGRTLDDIVKMYPEKRELIVGKLRQALDAVFVKEATRLVHHSIVHRLLYDYVRFEDQGKLRQWLPSVVESALVEVVHTLDGARAASLLMAVAGAKERKTFVKACRPYLEKIVGDEYAHFVAISLFACVDDTVLLEKTFVAELLKDLPNSLANRYTRQIFLFLYAKGALGRNHTKELVELAARVGELATLTSKKPFDLRIGELCALVDQPLVTHLLADLPKAIKEQSTAGLVQEMAAVNGQVREGIQRLFAEHTGLLEEEPFRVFLKRHLKRCPGEEIDQWLSALGPIDKLLESEAIFALITAIERDVRVRSLVAAAIARLPVKSESAKQMASLISRLNAGVSILPPTDREGS